MRRNWAPLSASGMIHLLLIGAAVAVSRRAAEAAPEASKTPTDPARHVDMVYIPPIERPREPNLPKPTAPRPKQVRKEPEPEPNAPPEAAPVTGSEVDDPNASKGNAPAAAAPPSKVVAEAATATLESEARRIFGRERTRTAPGAGPQATRPMEAYFPNDAERCVPQAVEARDSAGSPNIGTVVGRIYRQDSGKPLAGAHLQMLGAPYVAFTDDNGEYRFRFDLSLVDNCRTQYVRVTAPGYESRLLVLVVGQNVMSEDVRLRRR